MDPQTITALATGTAAVIVAVTGLIAELRRWRRKHDDDADPPAQ